MKGEIIPVSKQTKEDYLRRHGFEVVDERPEGTMPYVEMRPSDILPSRYDVWVMAREDVGVAAEFSHSTPFPDSIDEVTDFIAESLIITCNIPGNRRIPVFAEPKCRDQALALPEAYGGQL